jgi:hypothetical protein
MADRRQLYKYKGDRCTYCGIGVQEMIDRYGTFQRMFQFNHVDPRQKSPDYENLIERVISTDQLEEVDKCVLMCNECHGILHAQDITAELHLKVTAVNGKKAEQRLKGQLILDRMDRTATFLTNEPVLVHLYRVQPGSRRPRVHFGTELEYDKLLTDYLRQLPRTKTLIIRSWEKKVLMRARYDCDNKFSLSHDVSFPFIKSELFSHDRNRVWARNGFVLISDGRIWNKGTLDYEGMSIPPKEK